MTSEPATWWSAAPEGGVVVSLRVTPGARRSEVLGVVEDRLRLRIAAPATDGKANAEVQRVVAEMFGVRRSAVRIVRGERAREKTVHVAGVTGPPPLPPTLP